MAVTMTGASEECNAMYCKTSLKADREDWGGGLLETPAKHRENERQRDHSHRGARGTKGTNEILKSFQNQRKSY